jgi:MFS family permease
MNGIYLMMVSVGVSLVPYAPRIIFTDYRIRKTFLAPVASGAIADSQGWRWMYWWCTILFGINIVLFVFFYEETKFTYQGVTAVPTTIQPTTENTKRDDKTRLEISPSSATTAFVGINHSIPMRSYRQRLAFTTPTKSPFSQLLRHTYQPFIILLTFPAVAYTSLQ